ncbi:MAG: HipA N-terminal domain-containing protein [bacterium]
MKIYNFGKFAGRLFEIEKGKSYKFIYDENYDGPSISQTMPESKKEFEYTEFPPFFDGLLPEGSQLENLLRLTKSDRNDLFFHLMTVGKDLVGAITAGEEK